MVGHTGVYEAIKKAVATVDECAGAVIKSARKFGYDVLVIADHGNADKALNDDGSPKHCPFFESCSKHSYKR